MANIIKNGVPWYDQHNDPVNAHAGCLIKVNNLIYSQRYAKYPSNTCITRLMGILYFHLLSTQKEPQLWYS